MLIEKERDSDSELTDTKGKKAPKATTINTHQNNKTGLFGAEAASEWSSSEVAGPMRVLVATFPIAKNIFGHRIVTREKKKGFYF